LALQREKKRGRPGWWHYLLAGLLMSSEVSAQVKPIRPAVSQKDSKGAGGKDSIGDSTTAGIDGDIGDTTGIRQHVTGFVYNVRDHQSREGRLPDTLRGRLIDSGSGQPVGYAVISIDRTHGYTSDGEGYFAIPTQNVTGVHTLTISSVGYVPLKIEVAKIWADKQEKVIPLRLSDLVMGDVVTVVRRGRTKKPVDILRDSLAFVGFPKTCVTKKALTIYPNPVARGAAVTLTMQLDEPGVYTAQLLSLSGVLVETMEVEGNEKSTDVLMNIPATLAAGVYFVRLSNPAVKKQYTQEVVVL
jgi:hypothetical protein